MNSITGSKERALALLGSGLNNEVVATTMGVSAAYISELMADEQFREEVVRLRSEALTANTSRDRRIDALEDRVLQKIEETIDFVIRPEHILSYFRIINSAKRRGLPAQQQTIINNTVVNLQLPTPIVQRFVTAGDGNVVEVEGRNLATMPAKHLLENLAAGRNGVVRTQRYEEIAKRIPDNVSSS